MATKPRKSVSFSAMVKFFMQQYDIPTKRDIDRIMSRLDRLEHLMQNNVAARRRAAAATTRKDAAAKAEEANTALNTVLAALKGSTRGMTVKAMEQATGFDAKKIRNCFYRLGKQGRIKRSERGIYVAIK